jgi:anaerobic magnesium-protoporphyrin IX monomethyl ester cyclase
VSLIQLTGGETGRSDKAALSVCNIAEPLGLLCIDAYLRQAGYEVLFLHPNLEGDVILSNDEMLRRVVTFSPDVVAFSAMTNQVPESHDLACRIKAELPSIPIVVGGDHFSGYPYDLLNYESFDLAVAGEGESCIEWVMKNLGKIWQAETVPSGIYWKERGQLKGAGRALRIADINSLPCASRYAGLLKWSRVGPLMWPPKSKQTGMVSVCMSRGCPYACSYCDAREVWGKGVNWREPAALVEELRNVRDTFGVNTAFFVDLTFNSDRDKVFEVCQALRNANLGVSWYVLLRPGNPNDRIKVDRSMLEILKEAGCVKVGFGAETLSPSIGKSLRRASINDYLIDLMRWTDELGLLSKVFFIIGHPSETHDYYRNLSAYLERLRADEVRMSFLTPFPGTGLWHTYKDLLPKAVRYEDYTTFRPILPHPQLSSKDLQDLRHQLLAKYYFSPQYYQRVAAKVKNHSYLDQSFSEFFAYLHEKLNNTPAFHNKVAVA